MALHELFPWYKARFFKIGDLTSVSSFHHLAVFSSGKGEFWSVKWRKQGIQNKRNGKQISLVSLIGLRSLFPRPCFYCCCHFWSEVSCWTLHKFSIYLITLRQIQLNIFGKRNSQSKAGNKIEFEFDFF